MAAGVTSPRFAGHRVGITKSVPSGCRAAWQSHPEVSAAGITDVVKPPPLFVDPNLTPDLWQGLVRSYAEDVFMELLCRGLGQTEALRETDVIVKEYVNYCIGQSRLTNYIHKENDRKRKYDVSG